LLAMFKSMVGYDEAEVDSPSSRQEQGLELADVGVTHHNFNSACCSDEHVNYDELVAIFHASRRQGFLERVFGDRHIKEACQRGTASFDNESDVIREAAMNGSEKGWKWKKPEAGGHIPTLKQLASQSEGLTREASPFDESLSKRLLAIESDFQERMEAMEASMEKLRGIYKRDPETPSTLVAQEQLACPVIPQRRAWSEVGSENVQLQSSLGWKALKACLDEAEVDAFLHLAAQKVAMKALEADLDEPKAVREVAKKGALESTSDESVARFTAMMSPSSLKVTAMTYQMAQLRQTRTL